MADGLYQRYRPTTLEEVVGQTEAVKTIKGFGTKIPHAILFHGGPGHGKTTLARIVARRLNCPPENTMDYAEKNCGVVESSIDMVREIQASMTAAAMGGGKRVWVLDEVGSLSRARFAQEALLKILEDGPEHVHFLLCTTDPQKVLKAIRSRCTQIECRPLKDKDIETLVSRVAKAEKCILSTDVLQRIVEASAGSGRTALVELEKVLGLDSEDDRLAAVGASGSEKDAFELVKALIPFTGNPSWNSVAKMLEVLKEHEPEGLRQMILASARSGLLKNGKTGRGLLCYKAIRCLESPLYDKNSGHALLAAACCEIVFANPKG